MTEEFYKNFGTIWERYLSFEINRYREAMKYFGNANNTFVLQTVAWHNFHVLQKKQSNQNYKSMREQWGGAFLKFDETIPDKLSILAVSEISGLDKETTRRTVKNLVEKGWLIYSPSKGVEYSPTEENNQLMIKFNEMAEIPLFLNLANNIKKMT